MSFVTPSPAVKTKNAPLEALVGDLSINDGNDDELAPRHLAKEYDDAVRTNNDDLLKNALKRFEDHDRATSDVILPIDRPIDSDKTAFDEATIESCWSTLPDIRKELFPLFEGDNSLIPLTVLVLYVTNLSDVEDIFCDKRERFKVKMSIDSAYIIAGDYLIKGQCYKVRAMIMIAAIMADFLEVGFEKVTTYFQHRGHGIEDIEVIYANFPNISRTSMYTFKMVQMKQFLSIVHPGVKQILENRWKCHLFESKMNIAAAKRYDTDMPSWLANNEGNIDMRARKWMKVFLVDEYGYRREMDVHNSMTFGYFVLLANDIDVAIGKVRFEHKNRIIFASSSRKTTLLELGIEEGDDVFVEPLDDDDDADTSCITSSVLVSSKSKRSKNNKKKSPRKGAKKKRTKIGGPTIVGKPDEPNYKRQHFKALAHVFEEARPLFKQIRTKIDASSIEKRPPKVRSPKTKSTSSVNRFVAANNDPTGRDIEFAKVGKTIFRTLVGDESNLYNPCLSKNVMKPSTDANNRIVLDLHGHSVEQAMTALDKQFPIWVDIAMKGEYPFVIPVDIISGSGNQILADVVAQWIRRNPMVANRPKGFG